MTVKMNSGVQRVQQRKSIEEEIINVNLNTIASGAQEILVRPPIGEVWRLKAIRITAGNPSGATTGTHALYLGNTITDGGNMWLLSITNVAFGSSCNLRTEPTNIKEVNCIIATNESPLLVFYANYTNAVNTKTLSIRIIREVEYIG